MRDEDKVNEFMFFIMAASAWLPELAILLLPNNILLVFVKFLAIIFLLERLRYSFRGEFNLYLPIGRYVLLSAVIFGAWLLTIRTGTASILSITLVLFMLYVFMRINKANKVK